MFIRPSVFPALFDCGKTPAAGTIPQHTPERREKMKPFAYRDDGELSPACIQPNAPRPFTPPVGAKKTMRYAGWDLI
jgi:hypothetical protein